MNRMFDNANSLRARKIEIFRTRTQKEYSWLIDRFKKEGDIIWSNGDCISDDFWEIYGEYTVVILRSSFGKNHKKASYGNIKYLPEEYESVSIKEVSNIIKKEGNYSDIRIDGDISIDTNSLKINNDTKNKFEFIERTAGVVVEFRDGREDAVFDRADNMVSHVEDGIIVKCGDVELSRFDNYEVLYAYIRKEAGFFAK